MRPRLSLALLTLAALATGLLRSQGYRPETAAGKMTVPAGFRVDLVASEPLVRQPVAIDFDDQGRLWAMQYLQYPNPAGLKRAKVDRYSRTVYDRVPEPPPHDPKGADRLTILTGRGGKAEKAKDFVSGLNLASAFAFGHGGVFVLQTPYLLFYPDRDGDDVPDGEPDVLLTGFGMEDAHSVANSLTWGPDGWLYGCQGSTVTANVRGVEFQQGVWRYHPLTRKFELFCEGGGNSWGLDFDRHGNLLYSTNHGGFVAFHGVQGGYYWKAFGKHGPLHNPFAFGYFDHVPHTGFKGGHVSVAGFFYRGDSFPARFRGRYVAGDLLGHNVYWHEVTPQGSSFRTKHAGDLLLSNDTWFAPSDVTLGPDGAVYVADWHDQRTAHPDPDAEWDRRNGRVYRISAEGTKPHAMGDLRKLSSARLVGLLGHTNGWVVQRARRILADRRDPEMIFPLREKVRASKDEQLALEALWALYVSGGFTDRFAEEVLAHTNPHLRRWAVRFLGDEGKVSSRIASRLAKLATTEPHPVVRSQLASSANRLPSSAALPIVAALLARDEDSRDPHLPLLLWWAVEHHALPALEQVVSHFRSDAGWKSAISREVIQPRLMRRLAAAGTPAALDGCAKLLAATPPALVSRQIGALDAGLRGRPASPPEAPHSLRAALARLWHRDTREPGLIRVQMRLGVESAHRRAVELASDPRTAAGLRVTLLDAIGELGQANAADAVLRLVGGREPDAVRRAAIEAAGRFNSDEVASALLRVYPRLGPALRAKTRGVLLARHNWAKRFVAAVAGGQIDVREVPADELQPAALYRDAKLDEQVRTLWGRVGPSTPGEKLAVVRRLSNDLRAGSGDARKGRELFKTKCATCHKLFDQGAALGPDLTHANRRDQQYLLVSIIDPSAFVRKEYLSWTAELKDGRILTGLLVGENAGQLTLADAKNERTVISRGRIDTLRESPVSLMPEGLLDDVRPQQLRDLFAYLQGGKSP